MFDTIEQQCKEAQELNTSWNGQACRAFVSNVTIQITSCTDKFLFLTVPQMKRCQTKVILTLAGPIKCSTYCSHGFQSGL